MRPFADACSSAWRSAEIAASNGHGNARGIARIYAALAGGGRVDDVRILDEATVRALATEAWGRAPDLVLGYPMRRGRGVNLNTSGELGPNALAFGHTGTGGSLGYADPDLKIGVGYAMNQLWGGTDSESRVGRLVRALYACLR
ncbi:MAG: serine hydrolase [Pseudomonadales bacterium]